MVALDSWCDIELSPDVTGDTAPIVKGARDKAGEVDRVPRALSRAASSPDMAAEAPGLSVLSAGLSSPLSFASSCCCLGLVGLIFACQGSELNEMSLSPVLAQLSVVLGSCFTVTSEMQRNLFMNLLVDLTCFTFRGQCKDNKSHLATCECFPFENTQWRIHDFQMGRQRHRMDYWFPRWLRFKNFVCQNERIWTFRVGAHWRRPLDPRLILYLYGTPYFGTLFRATESSM